MPKGRSKRRGPHRGKKLLAAAAGTAGALGAGALLYRRFRPPAGTTWRQQWRGARLFGRHLRSLGKEKA